MSFPTDSIDEHEALQIRRLLAHRSNATALQIRAGLSYSISSLQPQYQHPPIMDPRFAVPALSSTLLDPYASSLLDLSRLQAFGRQHHGLIGLLQEDEPLRLLHHATPSPIERSGLHAMQRFSTAYRGSLLPQGYQQLPSRSILPARIQNTETPDQTSTASATPKRRPVESYDRAQTITLPRAVYSDCDDNHLSNYQCLLRKQIEFYESTQLDIKWSIQGRNKAIFEGQVGIRCKWCSHVPLCHRNPGAVYYCTTLNGLYQAAQNMAKNHLVLNSCRHVPISIKERLIQLRDAKRRSACGGKRYWSETASSLGLYECEQGGLRFRKKQRPSKASTDTETET